MCRRTKELPVTLTTVLYKCKVAARIGDESQQVKEHVSVCNVVGTKTIELGLRVICSRGISRQTGRFIDMKGE